MNSSTIHKLLGILCFITPINMHAQVFHFVQTSVTLNKSTAQSPAHWYIEIYNDVNVDTALRWKADLSNIPAGWTMTFDDQNNWYSNVLDGDSADFILRDSLTFPQKLIIGAFTNNIAANASAYFHIYNPADTVAPVIIEYIFNITSATGIVSAVADARFIKVIDRTVYFSFDTPTDYNLVSLAGQLIQAGKVERDAIPIDHLKQGIYFIYFFEGNTLFVKKIAL